MLFISILLSVWFVAWLVFAVFIRDTGKLFAAWLYDDANEDEEDTDNQSTLLLKKSENDIVYHLCCKNCNHSWWSIESTVNYCPNCGKSRKTED